MTFFPTKSASVSIVLMSVAIGTLQPAFAETKSKIQSIVQTNYNNINAAFLSKDIKRATAYFTIDYVSINPKGERQNLEEFRTHYNNLFTRFNIDLTSNKATIKKIAIDADGINVEIEQRTEGTIAKTNKIAIYQTSIDRWMKTPQGWRLKQSKIETNQTTFNGKTFNG
jgi:ketosteroid isomerase-like protein